MITFNCNYLPGYSLSNPLFVKRAIKISFSVLIYSPEIDLFISFPAINWLYFAYSC